MYDNMSIFDEATKIDVIKSENYNLDTDIKLSISSYGFMGEQNVKAKNIIYKRLLDFTPKTEDELKFKKWLFNRGDLRTRKEIKEHDLNMFYKFDEITRVAEQKRKIKEDEAKQEILDKENYYKYTWKKESAPAVRGWVIFIAYVILTIIIFENFYSMEHPVFTFLGMSFSTAWGYIIYYYIHCKRVVKLAEKHDIPHTDPILVKACNSLGILPIAIAGSVAITAHSLKKNTKSLFDTNSWKEI